MKKIIDYTICGMFYICCFIAWCLFCLHLSDAVNVLFDTSFYWNPFINVVLSLAIIIRFFWIKDEERREKEIESLSKKS